MPAGESPTLTNDGGGEHPNRRGGASRERRRGALPRHEHCHRRASAWRRAPPRGVRVTRPEGRNRIRVWDRCRPNPLPQPADRPHPPRHSWPRLPPAVYLPRLAARAAALRAFLRWLLVVGGGGGRVHGAGEGGERGARPASAAAAAAEATRCVDVMVKKGETMLSARRSNGPRGRHGGGRGGWRTRRRVRRCGTRGRERRRDGRSPPRDKPVGHVWREFCFSRHRNVA